MPTILKECEKLLWYEIKSLKKKKEKGLFHERNGWRLDNVSCFIIKFLYQGISMKLIILVVYYSNF